MAASRQASNFFPVFYGLRICFFFPFPAFIDAKDKCPTKMTKYEMRKQKWILPYTYVNMLCLSLFSKCEIELKSNFFNIEIAATKPHPA